MWLSKPMITKDVVPAVSSPPIPTALTTLPPLAPDTVADLRRYLAAVPDPRPRRGIRHPVGSVLALAAVAVATGTRSLTAIAEWAVDLAQPELAGLGVRRDPGTGRCRPPTESTMRRVLHRVDGDHLDAVISAWTRHHPTNGPTGASLVAIAIDGKTPRGTVALPAAPRSTSVRPHPPHRNRRGATPRAIPAPTAGTAAPNTAS